ncbi:MAG TPA: leucine--tRNA ligase [Longimicrobiales bacterium]|nr:leucine--tRNA ligase [Longimicrobiales bacterium]
MDYRPQYIEEKWQRRWAEQNHNSLSDEQLASAERPFYNLMMFPYPSAEGLHVGNMYAFTGADIYGRWKRLQGETVFEPIGFDAFGIHSENFALKTGTHPMELIPSNIRNFTRQLTRIGAMYDWNHVVDTTDPSYYRWTQWLFLQLYRAGLAEKKEAAVNWCPSCHTVLANEQVIAGACERCGTTVEQRNLSQWFFTITKYAQRLLDNLKWIDWSDTTKKAQENWIGRSEGAEIWFEVESEWHAEPGSAADSAVADARAHHHELGEDDEYEQKLQISVFTTRPDTIFGATFLVLAPEHPVVDWITTDARRAEVQQYRERAGATDLVTRKKADKEKTGVFTGAYAVNPATGKPVEIWIADYVLMEYGTGAIMAVPGHDERDFEFATQFGLPIVEVITNSGAGAGALSGSGSGDSAGGLREAYVGEGVLVNSGEFDGMGSGEAISAITAWLAEQDSAEPKINYRLHDWCISRQRYWGPPIPIIYCDACGTVPVPEDQLPVVLPHVDNYKPDESGVSPLARVESWYRVPCPQCGADARRETDVSDTFLDSAWYFLRYPSANRTDVAFDAELTRKWLPVDMYIGGEEHAVLHLLYSRFITMVLHDLDIVGFEEPFATFRKHGLLIKEGSKMSKSRGNVVIPDRYIEEWGADTFRTYLMFLGPYQEGGDFRDQGLQGPFGFFSRLWDTVVPVAELGDAQPSGSVEQKLHATIAKVTDDVAGLRYNTAIAAMMEYLNVVREGNRAVNRPEVEPLVVLAAPFAPHIAEELWELLGHSESIFTGSNWPGYDAAKTIADSVEFVVQVNGKVRARMAMSRGITQEDAQAAALADDNVRRFIDGAEVRKVIFVPDRLLNLVVG